MRYNIGYTKEGLLTTGPEKKCFKYIADKDMSLYLKD